ncbi:MAG: tRNA adenosine(34) deaminase TadA [Butyrivibrio sp.]|nr:tRNA adenosine(34) deaminase TadA [Butyrivibrio sp.]
MKKRSEEEQRREDQYYMREALKQARRAYRLGEVPIGCVIVYEAPEEEIPPQIIGRGYNRRNTDHSTLAHAEITAIRRASKALKDWRLEDCTIYITLEPCQMCAGAIVQARIPRVVYGASSPKAGCGGSILNILENPEFNHQVEVTRGVMEDASTELLQLFFKEMRARRSAEKRARSED